MACNFIHPLHKAASERTKTFHKKTSNEEDKKMKALGFEPKNKKTTGFSRLFNQGIP